MTTLIWTANRALHNYRMVEEGFCWEHGEKLTPGDDDFEHCSCGRSFRLFYGRMTERMLFSEMFIGKPVEAFSPGDNIYGPDGLRLTEGLLPQGAYWVTDWMRPEEPIPIRVDA